MLVFFHRKHQLCAYCPNTMPSLLTLDVLIVTLSKCFFFLNFIPKGSGLNLQKVRVVSHIVEKKSFLEIRAPDIHQPLFKPVFRCSLSK